MMTRFFSMTAALACLLAGTPAHAQTFPSRTVTIVVTAAAGGVTDILARAIAPRLSEKWGQQVIVENKGGGAHVIGAQQHGLNAVRTPAIRFALRPAYEFADGKNAVDRGQRKLPDAPQFPLHRKLRLGETILRHRPGVDEDSGNIMLCRARRQLIAPPACRMSIWRLESAWCRRIGRSTPSMAISITWALRKAPTTPRRRTSAPVSITL